MVDTGDLKSPGRIGRASSSLASGTIMLNSYMKTLYANGCSFTAGGGPLGYGASVDDMNLLVNHITWPGQLKTLLNFDNLVNDALGCGSNQRICRTAFNWVTSQSQQTLDNTIAVIQWTFRERFEYYVPQEGDDPYFERSADLDSLPERFQFQTPESWLRDISRWATVGAGGVVSDYENFLDEKIVKRALARYLTYTEVEGYYNWLYQCSFLHDLFTRHGVKYYFWGHVDHFGAIADKIRNYLEHNYNFMPFPKFERIQDDGHPSVLGHSQIAKHFKQIILEDQNKSG